MCKSDWFDEKWLVDRKWCPESSSFEAIPTLALDLQGTINCPLFVSFSSWTWELCEFVDLAALHFHTCQKGLECENTRNAAICLVNRSASTMVQIALKKT